MRTSQQLMIEYGNEREMLLGARMKLARATMPPSTVRSPGSVIQAHSREMIPNGLPVPHAAPRQAPPHMPGQVQWQQATPQALAAQHGYQLEPASAVPAPSGWEPPTERGAPASGVMKPPGQLNPSGHSNPLAPPSKLDPGNRTYAPGQPQPNNGKPQRLPAQPEPAPQTPRMPFADNGVRGRVAPTVHDAGLQAAAPPTPATAPTMAHPSTAPTTPGQLTPVAPPGATAVNDFQQRLNPGAGAPASGPGQVTPAPAAAPADPGNKSHALGQPALNPVGRVEAAPAAAVSPGHVTPVAPVSQSPGSLAGPATIATPPPSGMPSPTAAPAGTVEPPGPGTPAAASAPATPGFHLDVPQNQPAHKAMQQAQALQNIPATHQEAAKNIANDQTKTKEQKTSLLQDTLGISPGAAAALLLMLAGGYVAGKGMEMTGRVIGGAAAGFGGGHGGQPFYGSGMAAVPY